MERYLLLTEWKNNSIKMSTLPKTYKLNAISIKSPMAFSTEKEPPNLQLGENHRRPRTVKAILRKNNKAGASPS